MKRNHVSRNRIQLRRTIEEAEGYRELSTIPGASNESIASMMDLALRTLQRRGALVHGNGHACFLLGETLRDMKPYEEALMPLERSADLVPDDIHTWMALGWCYKRTGQLAKAIEALERAIRVDSSEAILHYNLACYWSLARNRTLALKYLARALEIDSNYRDKIADEPDFDPLRHDAEFKQLTGVSV
jgi:tetratricopeptide (TPR) repeat protein